MTAFSRLPERHGAYGYWIRPDGDILPVDAHGGHVDVLIAQGDADRRLHDGDIYEQAFKVGYVRIVAGTADLSCCEMQFGHLTADARQSLVALLAFLPQYALYTQRSAAVVIRLGDLARVQMLIDRKVI